MEFMGIFRVLLLAPNKRIKCSGLSFTPFVSASHTDAERHYFCKDHPFPCESRSLSHGNTRVSLHCGPRSRITFTLKSPSGLFKVSYLGSVRAVTNQWGSPLYMFDYDVFGTPLQDRPERYRHGFTGKEYDSWTGLYNYGFRDYSAMFGRFTSVDPIQDGHNWYAYVNSDPVNWLDPWGLKPCEQQSGEDKKKKKSIVAPVINFGKNIQKWAENTKSNIDEWAHNQKRKIKEDINKNTNAFLKKNYQMFLL